MRFYSLEVVDEKIGGSYLHGVNLVFHEAGHIIFAPLGRFMGILGGSLMQLLIPALLCMALLLRNRDPFGAALCFWWLGQNLLDLAPYIGDARALEIMLLGGVTGADAPGSHDWENILRSLGLLSYDRALAASAGWIGRLCMAAGLLWGAAALKGCRGETNRSGYPS